MFKCFIGNLIWVWVEVDFSIIVPGLCFDPFIMHSKNIVIIFDGNCLSLGTFIKRFLNDVAKFCVPPLSSVLIIETTPVSIIDDVAEYLFRIIWFIEDFFCYNFWFCFHF